MDCLALPRLFILQRRNEWQLMASSEGWGSGEVGGEKKQKTLISPSLLETVQTAAISV